MVRRQDFFRALGLALWFMVLTFPIMVIRVRPADNLVEWRWANMFLVGAGAFLLSLGSALAACRKKQVHSGGQGREWVAAATAILARSKVPLLAAGALIALIFPFLFSLYQTSIMTTALMYVMLGLGLNIVVGLAGLLDLGYVAFFAVGAYSYGLLHHHFGIGFWAALPIGGGLGALFGILLGFPVLRLRGDYLAIVTLGFGEIIRLVLENWNDFSFGPSGIANIPKPSFFGMALAMKPSLIFLYYLVIILSLLTAVAVERLHHSRIGRAWIALREDEIACQAMGIDRTRTKLTAFALGATWAGMAGVVFAAKTGFINPSSFTFIESAIILAIVVLGGMGSIAGVIVAAFILILLPEYLRAFAEYRMLLFGAVLVLMMLFRPQGLVSNASRTRYHPGNAAATDRMEEVSRAPGKAQERPTDRMERQP